MPQLCTAGHYFVCRVTGAWTCATCGHIDPARSGLSATRRKATAS